MQKIDRIVLKILSNFWVIKQISRWSIKLIER